MPTPKVTHDAQWLPVAGPVAVPAKEAGPQPSNFNSKTLVLGSDSAVRIPESNTRKRLGTTRRPGGREEVGGEGTNHLYSKVAVKSAEAQDSVVIPLLDDGHLGVSLDLSPNSRSFPPLFQDKSLADRPQPPPGSPLGPPQPPQPPGSPLTPPLPPPQ